MLLSLGVTHACFCFCNVNLHVLPAWAVSAARLKVVITTSTLSCVEIEIIRYGLSADSHNRRAKPTNYIANEQTRPSGASDSTINVNLKD